MTEVYLHDQDYEATVTVSEAGLELVNVHRVDTGSDLTLYVTFRLTAQSLICDSVQYQKSVQRSLSDIARSAVSSEVSHQSSPSIRRRTIRGPEQRELPYGSRLCLSARWEVA